MIFFRCQNTKTLEKYSLEYILREVIKITLKYYDEKTLSESIKMTKSQIRECLDFEEDKLIKVHARELLLKEILCLFIREIKQLKFIFLKEK